MGSIACAVLPILFFKFLFFRRFFSFSKEKKRQKYYNCFKIYAFTFSSLLYFHAPSSAVFEKGTIT